ncbi:MAG: XRE family transcriptional regulator [Planctomycetota bacterium]|nr:MAG: XRE family transcriptional regulator [Planctomycetota bacterium]
MPKTVADLCAEKGWNADQLAEQAGLEVDRTTAILLARWTPSPKERQKIAAALGVTADDVVFGHATPIQRLYGHGPS